LVPSHCDWKLELNTPGALGSGGCSNCTGVNPAAIISGLRGALSRGGAVPGLGTSNCTGVNPAANIGSTGGAVGSRVGWFTGSSGIAMRGGFGAGLLGPPPYTGNPARARSDVL
jgi:hypothetical protein